MTTKLLTVNEVSEILGLKPARVYELTRDKRLPFVLLGERQYRYSSTAIQNWIDNGGNQVSAKRRGDGLWIDNQKPKLIASALKQISRAVKYRRFLFLIITTIWNLFNPLLPE